MQLEKEYKQLTKQLPPANMTVFEVINQGLPMEAIDHMSHLLNLNKSSVANLLGVTPRAIQQRKQNNKTLNVRLTEQLTERALQIARIVNEATECFGSSTAALEWLKKPNKGLGDNTPLDLCTSFTGMESVRDSINRLKYGLTA